MVVPSDAEVASLVGPSVVVKLCLVEVPETEVTNLVAVEELGDTSDVVVIAA